MEDEEGLLEESVNSFGAESDEGVREESEALPAGLALDMTLKARIEALIFASQKPISVSALLEVLGTDISVEAVEETVAALEEEYKNRQGGFILERIRGMGFQ